MAVSALDMVVRRDKVGGVQVGRASTQCGSSQDDRWCSWEMIASGWQSREHIHAVGTVVADRQHSLRHGSVTTLERPPL